MTRPPPRRVWAVGIWLLLLALGLAVIAGARFSTDMSAFLPRDPDARQRLLVDQIRDGALSRMVLLGIEGGDAQARAQASRALAQRLRGEPAFAHVVNGDESSQQRDQALLLAHRYLLSPQVSAQRFSAAGLQAAIGHSVNELGGPAGLFLKAVFPRDPTGELQALLARLAGDGRGPGASAGVWATADGTTALLIAMTHAPGTDTDAQEQALRRLDAAFVELPGASGLRLLKAGAPVFSVDARQTIRGEVERLSLLAGGGIVLLMLAFYRSPRNLLLGLLPVASGVVMAIAAVALGFGTVHAITIGFGTTLMGETLDYSVYYLVQSGAGESWRRIGWPTLRLGLVTSICGYTALLFSSFPGLAQLGLYSVAGLIAAATTTRFVLPALPQAPVPAASVRWLDGVMVRLQRLLQALRWPLLALALAALALVWTQRGTLWAQGLEGLNPAPRALQQLDTRLRDAAGAPEPRFVVAVDGHSMEQVLQRAEQAEALLQPLRASGRLTRIDSPAHYLPSHQTQRQRRAALPDAATLHQRLQQALPGLPVQADRLQPFLDDVAQARQTGWLTPAALRGSSLGFALDNLLLQREGGWSALLPLQPAAAPDAAARHALQQAVDEALAGSATLASAAWFVDLQGQSQAMFGQYLDQVLAYTGAGALAVLLLLAASLRQPGRLLRVALPLACAVVLVMAGHLLAGHRLTLLHLIGLLLIVAVGSNYALFFQQNLELESGPQAGATATPAALASLALANVSTLIGFGVLALSEVPVLQAIGATVGPGALLAMLLAMCWSRRGAASAAG